MVVVVVVMIMMALVIMMPMIGPIMVVAGMAISMLLLVLLELSIGSWAMPPDALPGTAIVIVGGGGGGGGASMMASVRAGMPGIGAPPALGIGRTAPRDPGVRGWLGNKGTTYTQVVLLLPTMKTRDLNAALKVFRDKGGTLRTRDLIALGVHTDSLYALREKGRIIELGRGLYRLANVREAEYPDLAVVAVRAPNAAVCLISALSFHSITTQIPSSVHLAVPRGSYNRVKLSIPVTLYRFDPKTFKQGLETQHIGGMPLKIYSAARTVVDCFKFRNKLGLDVALEALRLARQRKRVQNRELLHFARLLRVEKPMSPYLQAIE